ncbi:Niacin transporter NiaP [Desulfosporosinus metallidurans]|uniref:Niacin transporter NiaP n=1 Tax=Desulfosporosinus metallidurans TaxID=1888891 RepID=A0A1Q8QZ37_9FIRM|nr:Niacin transporter NiaP [Desulfosporosinus metallidurans]
MSTLTLEKLTGRMERLPFSKIHKKVFSLAAMGYLFDAYDVALLGFIMPLMSKELHLTPVQIGFTFSIGLFGMLIGALIAGTLADKFGRLKIFQYTLLTFAIATGLTAFAPNYTILLVLRFITGLGLGGEQPVVFTFLSEMVPNEYRGRVNGMTEAMWGFGTLLAATTAFFVLPVFGWRMTFAFGVLPAILVWFFRLGIPESPRWYMIKGQIDKAEQQLIMIEKIVEGEKGPLSEPQIVAPITLLTGYKHAALMKPVFLKRSVVLWALWFFSMFGFWGVTSWMPTLIKQAGYSLYASIGFVFIMNLVWVPSGIVSSILMDKIGRKTPLTVYLVLGGIVTLLYGWVLANHIGGVAALLSCGMAVIFCMAGAFPVIFAYTPENYPTEIRGTGTGTANAWGRVGGILAPTIVGFLYPIIGLTYTLGVVAAAFALGGVVMALWGIETKNKILEEISNVNFTANV